MDSGLRGEVALVTGASGGIGQATARALAAEGARLVLHAHQGRAAVESLAAELDTECLPLTADLSSETDTRRLFDGALDHFAVLDVVVANAGIWPEESMPVHRMPLQRWNRVLAVNQTSVFLCAREFFRHLEQRRPPEASLVLVGSTAAVFGEAGHAEYAASKAAITYGLTRTLKNEIVALSPGGRVNAVCPGWTMTPMAEKAMEDHEAVTRVLQTRSLRRIARAEEIAAAIVFLASPRLAGHISGAVLTVAGGMEGRLLHDIGSIDPAMA